MILLHSYVDADDPRERRTWAWLHRHADLLTHASIEVRHVRCKDDGDREVGAYEKAVLDLWGKDDLLFLERDIVPTLPMLMKMLDCPEDVCAQRYNTGMPDYISAYVDGIGLTNVVLNSRPHEIARILSPSPLLPFRPAGPQDTHADRWGLGFTRIRRGEQLVAGTNWKRGTWRDMDGRISAYLYGHRVLAHLHAPRASHNHPFRWQDYPLPLPDKPWTMYGRLSPALRENLSVLL